MNTDFTVVDRPVRTKLTQALIETATTGKALRFDSNGDSLAVMSNRLHQRGRTLAKYSLRVRTQYAEDRLSVLAWAEKREG